MSFFIDTGTRGAELHRAVAIAALLAALGALMLAQARTASAQQLEPRSYSNAPIGLNFLLVGYVHQEGDVLLDPSIPLEDTKAIVDSGVLGYARVVNVFGQSGVISAALPYASITASGAIHEHSGSATHSGYADPIFKLSANLYGAPALSLQEFRDYRQDTIVGASLLLTAPWGRYNANQLVNIGTNRWTFRPEVGVSKALGNWVLEGEAGVTFFTTNDEYLRSNSRSQAPLYAVQAHLIYNFNPKTWGSLDTTYYAGGRTSVDGVENDDRQQNSRWGVTFVRSLDAHNSIKAYYSNGATVRAGQNFNIVGLAWQYRWGAGL
jgi:hypothetical protein